MIRYFHHNQEIQRAAITENVSTSYILQAADELTKAEAAALANPGRDIHFTIASNGTHRAQYRCRSFQ